MSKPASAQLFLGQEGWLLKFHEVRSQDFFVPLPSFSSQLLNLPLLEGSHANGDLGLTGQTHGKVNEHVDLSDDPGAYMQGYPLESSPRQRGAVTYRRPNGVILRIGWDFSPN